MADWWVVNVAAQAVMVVCYAWLSGVMLKGIVLGHQWRTNPVAVATFAIFATCTVGHFVHVEHTVLPAVVSVLASSDATLEAARISHGDPLAIAWHGATAVAAVWYLTMRSRLQVVHGGQALCEDMVQKQSNAMAMHDQVMAGLARARARLDEGDRAGCEMELENALGASRSVITHLLGKPDETNAFGPGDLRRRQASG